MVHLLSLNVEYFLIPDNGSLFNPWQYQRRKKMKKTQRTQRMNNNTRETVLHLAFELSNTKWKIAFSDESRKRHATIDDRNLKQLPGRDLQGQENETSQ